MRLILAAAFAALAACSDKPPEPATPASGAAAIISAERDFASDATRTGWVEAFEKWSAPDAVLLGQGPEPASQFLANIDPANRKDTSLHWAPEFAGASAAGDFGFTAGPFNGDGSTFGYYLTVWRQQPDGEWRWLYNGGVDTKTPATIDPAFNVALIDPTSGGEGAADVAKTAIDILEAGLATSAASDAHVSLSSQFAANARMHRADTPPIIGDEAITKAIEAGPQTIDFKQLQSFAATGGDMVFTLGEARWKNDVLPDGTGTDAFGIYNRVWASTGDGWRIVFDQIVPRDLPANPQQ